MAGEAAPPDPKAPEADPKTPPATTPPAPNPDPEGLGEAGLKALRAERARGEKAERDLAALRAENDDLRAKTQTEAEKAVAAAKKEGRAEAEAEANRRIVRSELRAISATRVSDPEDAAALLGDLDRFVVKGEVDTKAITSAIDELVKAKPYLAPAGKARPLPGGSATQSSGVSINDAIRQKAGRG